MTFNPSQVQIPSNIKLADESFYESGPVDMLLGAEVFWKALRNGQIKPEKGALHLQETKFGWVAGGVINPCKEATVSMCNLSLSTLDKQIRKFWELDQWAVDNNTRSAEDRFAEEHFTTTHKRGADGRFIVKLPFKASPANIGTTREIAMKRYFTLERKIHGNSVFAERYREFMKEYEDLNHMVPVTEVQAELGSVYLPHHGVIKESSTTTKLRVVFDASLKSSNGASLNDVLAVGPRLQDDLTSIIVRFRFHQFVITADISKMYRQILIAPEDRKYQKIIWRDNQTSPITTFELNTVTYGTACAPFIAVKCLQQLAAENKESYPDAYPVIIHDFYMDDMLTGADSAEDVVKIRQQVTSVLARGQFELRKWAANSETMIPFESSVATANSESGLINFDKSGEAKTLGIYWNCKSDLLKYEVTQTRAASETLTKRKILSVVAKIFDPLNLLGPVTIKAKILIQKLWELKLGWDEKLPVELERAWTQLFDEFRILNEIKIPRKVINSYPYRTLELHGFCDASQQAYGACIYIRTVDRNGKASCNLVCAKSRVAPLKTISIPRLELCAGLLLAKLIKSVVDSLRMSIHQIMYWTDSTIVLAWLASSPSTLNTFVANRVSEIQTLTEIGKWHHVRSEDNPADVISRGMLPSELINCQLWYHGPTWLLNPTNQCSNEIPRVEKIPETRKLTLVTVNQLETNILHNFSSFSKLRRVVATCLRFSHNCKNNPNKRTGEFSSSELIDATTKIIKLLQRVEFAEELVSLETRGSINKTSKLRALNPFRDDTGLIRVGGRLSNADISHDQKHPIVLPKHHVTQLIIKEDHESHLHAGPTATLAAIRLKFWPLAGRNQVRQVIRKCLTCTRLKSLPVNPIMGDLPASRTIVARPFLNTGVDYAGPLIIKDGKTRNKRTVKAYVALFICFSTKAIHLELVGDLSTDSFLGALKRFVARRGLVENIYSDNATNFVGAQNELKTLFKTKEFNEQVLTYLGIKNIHWHFIPPRAPHFGGIWEAGVKSAKFHLKRVVGNAHLTYEEMYTLLTGIEACLNSRPLCPLTDDPYDVDVLTPGHFLIGGPLTAVPDKDFTEVPTNRLNRWSHLEKLRQHFWQRWSREYLSQLQTRSRWQHQETALMQPGTLVFLRDSTPPLHWKRGRVVEVHPGKDGVIRVVSVRVENNVIKRAVRTLSVLPVM